MTKSRYIMIGGFLGAGKTTAIQKFAQHLTDQGLSVGLITNDQGAGLVDSALGRSNHFPVEEISGGCFCCRFNSLIDAARKLTADTRPDVFLAEPVGSCTDLVATVSLPLRKIYGDDYQVSALSVLVDPIRALRVLELEEGKKFSERVRYIYLKQLEEAEIIVINKTDLLADTPDRLELLRKGLSERFPEAQILEISARHADNLDTWFHAALDTELRIDRFLEIDYQTYGDGEALLGWLNATIEIETTGDKEEFDGNEVLQKLAPALRKHLNASDANAEIAHLKMTLTPIGDPNEIAAINLVRDDSQAELSHRLVDPLDDGELLLNIRAEAAPEHLDDAVNAALAEILVDQLGLGHKITHSEHFRPGMPTPTHRLTEA